jgi:hypothetical protein
VQTAPAFGDDDRLPPELRAIPIHPADETHPLRLCVLARIAWHPIAGPFFELRRLHDARVYLGCVSDVGGRVREWVEVWVQTIDGLDTSLAAHRQDFSNYFLDARWVRQCEAVRAWSPESFIETGWETRPPPPTLFDSSKLAITPPRSPEGGGNWALCQDDALLEEAQLPPYRTSLTRYLYNPLAGKTSQFVPVAGETLQNARTLPADAALGLTERVVPFNAHGGRMMMVRFHPLGYEDEADLLGGKPWSGLVHGETRLPFGGVYQSLTDANFLQNTSACLFLGAHGRAGRLVEALHLKLQLLADVLRATRACVAAHQLPFLNLAPESFRVKLAEVSTGLPFLWTARCTVVQPTRAVALQIKTTERRLFVRTGQSAPSIYLPDGQIRTGRGLGTVRVRKVLPHEQNTLIIEGTLVLQEPVRCSPRDILWVRLPVGTGLVDLFGHIESEGLAASQVRFRTTPQQLPEAAAATLRSGTQAVFPPSEYEILPLLSSPCDLYSLGVIAIRTLLVNEPSALPAALDDLLSLAGEAATTQAGKPLPARIAAIFAEKTAWRDSLGPQRLLAEELTPSEAITLLPAEIWYDVLAAIVRLFPGANPDSHCADLGDAPPLALETVFDGPLADLDKLLLKTRSLIVIDWSSNREIHEIIEELRRR